MVWDNGITYEGEWDCGKFHGVGSKLYSRGGGYSGSWVEGQRQGEGAHVFAGKFGYERWRGPFEADQPHGVGVMKYTSGDEGEFEFLMGKPQLESAEVGQAKYDGTVADLDDGSPSTVGVAGHYSGGWDEAAGRAHGFGVMTWENGIVYKGMWKGGKYHGHGRKLYSRGGGYEGGWVDGKRAGEGVSFFDEHAHLGKHGLLRWEGPFVNDKPHGSGQAYVAAPMEDDEHERWAGDTAVKGPIVEFVEGGPINFPVAYMYCTDNGHFVFNFLLKMQRLWRIAPENDDFQFKKRPFVVNVPAPSPPQRRPLRPPRSPAGPNSVQRG